jgi:hypothetical protein
MLREKLVAVGGDLVVAKSRVKELEMNLLDDKLSLKKSAETLLGSSGFFGTSILSFIGRANWLQIHAC